MSQVISTLSAVRTLFIAVLLSLTVPAFAQTATDATMQRKQVTITNIASQGAVNSVTFSGQVTIASRKVIDEAFGAHKLILVFDLSGLSGTKGKTTLRTAYQEEFMKPLAANYNIDFVFPVSTETESTLGQVIQGVARFALNVDVATGNITSATAAIASR